MPLTAAEQAELVVEIQKARRLFDDISEVWDDETARVRLWHAILERVRKIDREIRQPVD